MNWLRGWKRLRYIIGIGVPWSAFWIYALFYNGLDDIALKDTIGFSAIIIVSWIFLLLIHVPIVWVINGFTDNKKG